MKLTDDFLSIVLNETPLLDVRAPVEFTKGAFINATNIAILEDKERHLVGTKYKEEGNAAAVKLAQELIQTQGQELRIQKWKEYLQKNPNALLYCFRGGQRSGISQAWLEDVGINITRLKGGYKAFRNYLMQESLDISASSKTLILGGRTGSGKTILLKNLKNMIDLEALANHRGSSFGNFATSQPSQIDFENTLAYKLIQHHHKNYKHLVIEHESQNIGRSFIPKPVYENFMNGELIILETPIDKRVEITLEEYIVQALKKYAFIYKEDVLEEWAKVTKENLIKMKKRLGNEKYLEFKELFENALSLHIKTGDIELYKTFIKKMLVEYYDPMYDYQIKKSKIPTVFKGNAEEVLQFINSKEESIN